MKGKIWPDKSFLIQVIINDKNPNHNSIYTYLGIEYKMYVSLNLALFLHGNSSLHAVNLLLPDVLVDGLILVHFSVHHLGHARTNRTDHSYKVIV